ncbi:MAG: hypothetical protein JSW39_08815 [Desulfobacterales bacterium]|nr:MAG: hypothetical protein JSW39_08815 [Desulfobacterales bacterium]
MGDKDTFLPLAQKSGEHDRGTAAHIIEGLAEKEAATIIESLPPSLAAHLDSHLVTSILMHLLHNTREHIGGDLSGELKGQIRELLE